MESSFTNIDAANRPSLNETTIENISESGIRFRSSQFIPLHHRLSFKLNLPKRKTVEATVQPAWIKEIPSTHQYDIGGRFIMLSEEDRTVIRRYVTNPNASL